MSFYLLSDSEESWQRTLVHQTMFVNNVVFIEQFRDFSHDNWVTSGRFIISKSIIGFVAILPGKNLPVHASVITSGGLVPPQKLHLCEPQDIGKLPDETKQTLFKYNCDCVPLSEYQLGAEDARGNFATFWGIQLPPPSPTSSSGHSVTATRLSDPGATTTPQTKCSSFFESLYREHVPWIFGFEENRQNSTLQGSQKQILNHPKHQRYKLIREIWLSLETWRP